MIDIFQDRATVRKQKIALLKENIATERSTAKTYRRQSRELDEKGYASFFFIWGIDDDSEEPIREMEQNYLSTLDPDRRTDFVRSLDEMRRQKIKVDYRAAAAGDNIREMQTELSRLQGISRKEAVAGLMKLAFHLH